ncbi:helix-turn-helix transcriptional regulator [Aquincola sp. S2]|uniref:Helix-turn-helix transcriptional regulator n=1 Tax=Pseudaquabacterium terrae TaxID=2732868 RepID=A0ABX2EA78_9BURK|nr:helix-turn-helix transcriptional regulator [Aquabacterium terrae]NRF65632.1 helix-turn-helix transcriptional regulator [Aquabacterium terrae]
MQDRQHASGQPTLGPLLRQWRSQRRRSQLDLALDVGISARHLSFIETGRSRPSAQVLMALAQQLELPLRERNRLLLAGGYAPRFAEREWQSESMAPVRAALQRLLDAHHPYPGVVLDRQWNVVMANGAAKALVTLLPPWLMTPHLNVFRASLHPEGMAAFTLNFADWGTYLLDALRRAVQVTGDRALMELEAEVLAYPNVAPLREAAERQTAAAAPPLLVPCVMQMPFGRLSLFTTLTTFGTPRDVTLEELCVELFYPADEASEALLRAHGTSAER